MRADPLNPIGLIDLGIDLLEVLEHVLRHRGFRLVRSDRADVGFIVVERAGVGLAVDGTLRNHFGRDRGEEIGDLLEAFLLGAV